MNTDVEYVGSADSVNSLYFALLRVFFPCIVSVSQSDEASVPTFDKSDVR